MVSHAAIAETYFVNSVDEARLSSKNLTQSVFLRVTNIIIIYII